MSSSGLSFYEAMLSCSYNINQGQHQSERSNLEASVAHEKIQRAQEFKYQKTGRKHKKQLSTRRLKPIKESLHLLELDVQKRTSTSVAMATETTIFVAAPIKWCLDKMPFTLQQKYGVHFYNVQCPLD